jgi:signal transduction histidine kinase/ligand-binding sensor domain-containing protein
MKAFSMPLLPCSARQLLARAAAVCTLLLATAAQALNPSVRLSDYHHTTWTAKDGAPSEVLAMAQTPDGWLWLAGIGGLYRFDGVRFERYQMPQADDAARHRINNLFAPANGDLWILYAGGYVTILHPNGRTEQVPYEVSRRSAPLTIALDTDGSAWIGGIGGLTRYQKGVSKPLGTADTGIPPSDITNILLDQRRQMWVQTLDGLYVRERPGMRFHKVVSQTERASLLESPDGRLWLANRDQVQLVPQPEGAAALPRAPGYNQTESRYGGQFDRDGNLWIPDRPHGLMLLRGALKDGVTALNPVQQATDRFDQAWQMSSRLVNGVLEDREGNIWISTQAGLERLRENRLVTAHVDVARGFSTIAHDTEGHTWVVDALTASAWRFSGKDDPVAENSRPYVAAANGRDGALLLGTDQSIERRYHGQITQIPLPPGPDGKPLKQLVMGILDDGKNLWTATREQGMFAYADGVWTNRTRMNLPPIIVLGAAGPKGGQLWLANADNTISFFDNGKLTNYKGPGIGFPSAVHVGEDVLVAGDRGLSVLQNGAFRTLHAQDPEVLTNVSGISVTADGDRWLNGNSGLVHVRAADWHDAIDHPERALRYELFDASEGYSGRASLENRTHSAYTAPDGELWFLTTTGVLRMDRKHVRRNDVAPQVQILRVETDKVAIPAQSTLRLPPASQNFSIQFTAPSLTKPEGVRFQYQLIGVDADWQDAGARRAAYYTNIAPGKYQFRVRAFNEDGVPSANTAEMGLRIEPTIPQTLWFKGLCLMVLAVILMQAYRYRMEVVTARVARELHIRMAERERIARTLHDSFLQSVQSLSLRLGTVVASLPEDSPSRGKLLPVLEHADATISEGRDQVHELRSGRVDDVETSVREAAALQAESHPGIDFHLVVQGARKALQPLAAEELCEIVREALRNAYRHAQASRIEAVLDYGAEQFNLRIADNGKGIDLQALAEQEAQQQRHWGLVGMHERARRVGGRVEIDSRPGAGTRVNVSIPARLAYLRPRGRWWRRR